MSLTNFTVYKADGTILRTGACPSDQASAQANAAAGEYVIYTASDPVTDRVNTGSATTVAKAANAMVMDKSTFTANGVDKVTITNVPNPSMVSITPDIDMGLTAVVFQLTGVY